jgi:adenylate cyclase
MSLLNWIAGSDSSPAQGLRNWYWGLGISVLITLVAAVLQYLPLMQVLEAKTMDARTALLEPPTDAADSIILIGIDDGSLKYFDQNGVSWPWPRVFYAHLLNYLTAAGARGILFDLLFHQADIDRGESDAAENDAAFADAIAANGRVSLACQLSQSNLGIIDDLEQFALPMAAAEDQAEASFEGILAPIPPLLEGTWSLGAINVEPDPDGIIRRVPLFYRFREIILPQLAMGAYLDSNAHQRALAYSKGRLQVNELSIPLDSEDRYRIHWYGTRMSCDYIRCVPFAAVVQSASATQLGRKPPLDPEMFKDKFVIIGATAAGLMDLKSTPISEIQPGMEIWATILLNLIHNDFIKSPSMAFNLLQVWVVAMVTFFLLTRFSGLRSHALALLVPALLLGETYLFWQQSRLALNLSLPLGAFGLSYLIHTSLGYLAEQRLKRQISRAMARYLHPDLVDQIARDPDRIEMGGEEIEATVLFSDIYNFTTISEGYAPKTLVSHLNSYFSDISRIVLDHGGMLDKYTGDGIMAIFGAPLPLEDHALRACRAALAHKEFSQALGNGNQMEVFATFHQKTRLGLHSGKIVAGNIGSSRRMDYTAIGDSVNLAARLEGVNKIFKTQIIISEASHELVKGEFICRELDYLRVKGKKEPTRIFELLTRQKPAESRHYQWIDDYHLALSEYRLGNWDKAIRLFKELAHGTPADQASLALLGRCRYLIKNPPEDWDGVLKLEVK